MLLSTVAALAAAGLFALTTNLQRVAAASVPAHGSGPAHLVRRLVADRRWLLGGLIGVAALGLHAVALARGGVLVVQSVMALGLVIALHLEAVRERRRLRGHEILGAALVTLGVVIVVAVGRPADRAGVDGGPVLAFCLTVAAASLLAVVGSRRSVIGPRGAFALAAAAGACFAVDAVFLQRVAALLDAGTAGGSGVAGGVGAAVVVRAVPDLAGFLVASMIGGVAVHRAYQVAPLRSVQPALAAAEPVTAFLLGVTVLREGVQGGALGYLALVAGLLAVTTGILTGLRPVRTVQPVAGNQDCQVDLWPSSHFFAA